ncbi:hypothetical protein EV122DRAFT_185470, partial [Schizophyllum commune]
EELKGLALKHFNANKGVLRVGHEESAESIYHNIQLYPRMFPWLFPYGAGGVGSTQIAKEVKYRLSEKEHVRHLLMYHDQRFQRDPAFPFVAFSHSQVKQTITRSFLVAKQDRFHDVITRLLNLNRAVL